MKTPEQQLLWEQAITDENWDLAAQISGQAAVVHEVVDQGGVFTKPHEAVDPQEVPEDLEAWQLANQQDAFITSQDK